MNAATFYVAPSGNDANPGTNWSTAKQTIQAAIDIAVSNDTVLVSNGVYNTGGRVVSFGMTNRVAITNAITVQSVNGPTVTIIQGKGPIGPDAVRCVYVGPNARLFGFTLTNGNTVVTNNVAGSSGGGAFAFTSSLISNCVIVGNSAWLSGGGVYAGTVVVSTIAGNYSRTGGGGTDLARLVGCVVSNNATDAVGGGVAGGWAFGSTITRNTAGTSGGGVSGGAVTNCIISFNSAADQGGGINGAHARNCAIIGNTSGSRGGGIYSSGTGIMVINCTIAGNRSARGGGVDGPSVTNSVVYHNWAFLDENWGSGTFGYSCLFPLPPGIGNSSNEPVLAGAYRIASSSPCVGAGISAFAAGTDLDGEAWNIPPSMGCDEINVGSLGGPLVPTPWVSATNVPVGYPIRFIADIPGRVASSRWNFADGEILTNRAVVQRVYNSTGAYSVVLTAYNESFPAGVSATVVVHVAAQQTHYVRLGNLSPVAPYTNWFTAATNIQDAIDAATQIGALVLVSNGAYASGGRVKFGGLTNRVVVDKALRVQSVNGPAFTSIVGAGPTGAAAVRCVWVGNDAVLSGFTLTNGHTHATGDATRARSGGGAWSEPRGTISNCVFDSNVAEQRGAGAMFGLVYASIFTNNRAGFYGGGASDLIAFDSRLFDNRALRGGGANQSVLIRCRLERNTVSENGGGMYFGTADACLLVENRAESFGGGADNASLFASALYRNSAGEGGGGSSASRLSHCTVIYNSTLGEGGGTRSSSHTNTIVYFNSGSAGMNWALAVASRNSCSLPVLPGAGNVSVEPGLASLTHLSGLSPLLGLGLTNVSSGTDIDGEPWSQPPDIGCDELTIGSATGALSVAIRVSATNLAVGARLEVQAEIDGRLTNSVWQMGDGIQATNRPVFIHSYSTAGTYTVLLTAFNESFPGGVSTGVVVQVVSQMVHYVNISNATPAAPFTTWSTAATNIQQAILAATQQGALILVSNGTYSTGTSTQRSMSLNRVTINKPVTVRSVNGPAVTWITGAAGVRGAYVGTNATLSGFTIAAGNTPTIGGISYYEDYCGGGVWCEPSAEVTNCVIRGNTAESGGGGVFGGVIRNSEIVSNVARTAEGGGGYGATFHGCLIVSNRTLNLTSSGAGGGVSSCVLYDSTLEHNRAGTTILQEGGGAYLSLLYNCIVRTNVALRGGGLRDCVASNTLIVGNAATQDGGGSFASTLEDCTVVSNLAALNGGGAYGGTITRSAVLHNRSSSGAGIYAATGLFSRLFFNIASSAGGGAHGSSIREPLINCLVFGNSAGRGGGASDVGMRNTTVVGNTASTNAGGLYITVFGSAPVANSIIMSNTAPANPNWFAESTDLIHFTCTFPTNSIGSIITNDPQFIDYAATNLRLQATSPCVNAGDNFWVANAVDLDGNPRVSGTVVDMGAYEFVFGAPDTDGDGIPDWWESLYYGGPTNADAGAQAANGVNTVLEAWIAGLAPTNPASFFLISGMSNSAMTQSVVRLNPTLTDRVYQLSASTNLIRVPQLWFIASSLRTGTGANLDFVVTNVWTDAYFRVNVQVK